MSGVNYEYRLTATDLSGNQLRTTVRDLVLDSGALFTSAISSESTIESQPFEPQSLQGRGRAVSSSVSHSPLDNLRKNSVLRSSSHPLRVERLAAPSNFMGETIPIPSSAMNDSLPTGERILYSEWRQANLPSLSLLTNAEQPIILADQIGDAVQPLIEEENKLGVQLPDLPVNSEPLITPLIWNALAPRSKESDTINAAGEEPEAIRFFKRSRMKKSD